MASPFRVFRKHQKTLLAVFGVLIMLSFVFIPVIMDRMSVRTRREDPVVVSTTRFGSLRQIDVQMLEQQQRMLSAFLERAAARVQQAGGQPMEAYSLLRRLGTPSEESAVNTWLLSKEAERQGLTVDNTAINQVLTAIASQRLTSQDIQDILSSLRLRDQSLFEALRMELLALRLQELFQVSLAATTPAQRWDYFQRLNRKASVELAAVPVIRFVDQVADPGEATLKEFFDKHKKQFPDPSSPEPGFRIPRKAAFEYFKADYEKFVQATQVSDQDVQKYYEEHKDNYKREALPGKQPGKGPQLPGLEESTAPKAGEPSPTGKPEQPKAPETSPEKKPEQPKAPGASPEKKPDQPKAPETSPEKKPEQPKAPETSPDKKPGPAAPAKGSSLSRPASPFRLVSMADSAKEEPAAKQPAKSEPAKPEPAKPEPAKSEPAKSEPAKSEPAKSEPAKAGAGTPGPTDKAATQPQPPAKEEKPAAQPQPPAKDKEAAPAANAAKAAQPVQVEAKPTDYLPLAEVKDEIRRQLTRQRATEKISELFKRLEEPLNAYQSDWTLQEATVSGGTEAGKAKPLVRPDFQKLAEGTLLTVSKTDLLPAYQAYELDIGKSMVSRAPFARAAYSQGLLKFHPTEAIDNEGNRYLFWKTQESDERIADFNDPATRKQVLHEWKMIRARDLANQEAKRLADEARKTNKPLKEAFAGRQDLPVTEAGPFTWLTYGSLPQMYWGYQPPTVSDVEGVRIPGDTFMQAVFHLEPGQIGVAMNQPETMAYVVRVKEFTPLPQVLWTTFTAEHMSRYAAAGAEEWQEVAKGWLQEMQQSAGLEWKRDPNRPRERPL